MSIHHYPHYPYLNEEDFNHFQDRYASLQPYPKAKYAATEICARHTLNRIVQIDDAATLAIMIENGADMYTKFSTGIEFFEEAVRKGAYKVMDCLYAHNYDKDATFGYALWGYPALAEKIIDKLQSREEIGNALFVVLNRAYKDCIASFIQILAKHSEEDIVAQVCDKETKSYLLEVVLGSYENLGEARCEECALLILNRATNPASLQAFMGQIENAQTKYPNIMIGTDDYGDDTHYPKLRDSLLEKAELLKVSVEKKYLEKTIVPLRGEENKEVFRI